VSTFLPLCLKSRSAVCINFAHGLRSDIKAQHGILNNGEQRILTGTVNDRKGEARKRRSPSPLSVLSGVLCKLRELMQRSQNQARRGDNFKRL
jgi:hypothetical protein